MMTGHRHLRLQRAWDGLLIAGALAASVWLAWLWARAARLPAEHAAMPGPVPAKSASVALRPASRSDEAADAVAALERRLAALERRIGELRPAPSQGEPALAAPLPDAGGAQPGFAAMAAWSAPFAADEVLAELTRELDLAPTQLPALDAALRGFFREYYRRLGEAFAGRGDEVAVRDLEEALDRELRAALTPAQFTKFAEWRERRK